MKPDAYISVDIEADGPIPGAYSMLSLGACLVDDEAQTFYTELRPISDAYVPEALAVSGLDRQRLVELGPHPEEAMASFRGWIDGASSGRRPVFVSFSTWDWVFVYYYLMRFGGTSPFGHSSLDIKSFYSGRCGGNWNETAKRAISRMRPLLLQDLGPHTHHALDDAKEQAELFRRLLLLPIHA